jgi:hypothetical protein
MRVLITHHFPLRRSPSGHFAHALATALMAAGHEVHALIVDRDRQGDETFPVRRVVCRDDGREADMPLDIPSFAAEPSSGQTFEALSDRQLADYREVLRRHLDIEVDRFNPQVIHAQHVWILGQLALETGVPYVVSAWGPELASCAGDPRYRALAEQAADNAGRILAPSESLARRLADIFDRARQRTLIVPAADESCPWDLTAMRISAIYETVLSERFGRAAP